MAKSDIAPVRHMIRCTGVNVSIAAIPFASAEERIAGFALATADLLGQMAPENYIERLPDLYAEFEEAARFDPGSSPRSFRFESLADMMGKTHGFWQFYVYPKITNDFENVCSYLNTPYPDGPNGYIERIERNLARLKQRIQAVK